MTQEIRTITIGAGQARPRRRSQKHTRRRVRLNGWTVAKYAALTVAGVLLFRAGAAYALTERGYKAIGGEVFALFLPVFYYCYAGTTKNCWTKSKSGSGNRRTTKGGGTMTKYTTIAGDMWDAIAYKTLGDEAYTDRIMKLNPEYRRLFVFPAGIVLTIPEPESQVAAGLPPWKRGTA